MAEQHPETDATSTSKLKSGWQALAATVAAWPRPRKIALAAVTALILGLFALIIVQGRTADYQLLYGNLTDADASAVVNWLKGQNIPYQLGNNGHNILIPAKDVHETRLSLASLGLPQGGGIGFEIFDKQSFALTDFVQKVNYSRALQGELARTIASLGPVETARVHLALPEKRLFRDQQKPATASVIIKLAPGKRLNEPQIEGIVHLVSSSIEGLDPQHVTVIDQNGNVLSRLGEKGMTSGLSPDMLEFQMQVEQRLEDRAQALLDKSLGAKNAMVRVSATLDFAKTEKTEETFDPEEPVIRSEQLNEEKSGSELIGGVPGVQSNLEGATAQNAGVTPPTSRSQRTTNYEISKVVSRTVNPVGTVHKLSVSVLVADKVVPARDREPAKTEPRTADELKALETMVASALGLDAARGDKIEVTSMPFIADGEGIDGVGETAGWLYPYLPFIRYGLLALGGLLLYFFFIRPLMKTLNREVTQHYKTVQQMEAEQMRGAAPGTGHTAVDSLIGGAAYKAAMESPPVDTLEKVRKGVENDPVFSAHVLKGWIHEQS
ncbi:flagellar basal-body MS-ring/collar protein FliF [Desulfobulbus elongatus]|uniref:flagellar basal-body MS-ring/collar protein FliF n=1 Tax=Desulfobulbus elongatus TaxID=53332 RepID=UPI00047FB287|nr:flagellar basal-body MS-ring/collar protein FliF [Desulfobulbus elongatus]